MFGDWTSVLASGAAAWVAASWLWGWLAGCCSFSVECHDKLVDNWLTADGGGAAHLMWCSAYGYDRGVVSGMAKNAQAWLYCKRWGAVRVCTLRMIAGNVIIETTTVTAYGWRDAAEANARAVLRDAAASSRVHLFVNDASGAYFRSQGELPTRTFATIHGVPAELVPTCERFFAAKAQYARLGRSHRLGLLLQGPPGTGKSSSVRALADRFRLAVYRISLRTGEKKCDISDLVGGGISRGIMLLEDVDTVPFDVDSKSPSLGDLLNALDGFTGACDDTLVVMTTNHPERLDPRLVRPGRVDAVFTYALPSDADFRALFCSFYPGDTDNAAAFAAAVRACPLEQQTIATHQTFLMHNAHRDAAAAVKALMSSLNCGSAARP